MNSLSFEGFHARLDWLPARWQAYVRVKHS